MNLPNINGIEYFTVKANTLKKGNAIRPINKELELQFYLIEAIKHHRNRTEITLYDICHDEMFMVRCAKKEEWETLLNDEEVNELPATDFHSDLVEDQKDAMKEIMQKMSTEEDWDDHIQSY